MSEVETEFLFETDIELEPPQMIGQTPQGNRMIFYVKGGSFQGPKLKGEVLPGGGDWFLMRPDGVGELDVRGTFRTDDGALVYVTYRGILHAPPQVMARAQAGEKVDPGEYYFRTAPLFQTASEKYDWLNRIQGVGVGWFGRNRVGYRVYAIR
ncbi:MAG: DUF3237 domain-containing protein [Chloroflexota bacterium]|nr:DUF3237 domain-containing protein [Chloroflexota bacterium]